MNKCEEESCHKYKFSCYILFTWKDPQTWRNLNVVYVTKFHIYSFIILKILESGVTHIFASSVTARCVE